MRLSTSRPAPIDWFDFPPSLSLPCHHHHRSVIINTRGTQGGTCPVYWFAAHGGEEKKKVGTLRVKEKTLPRFYATFSRTIFFSFNFLLSAISRSRRFAPVIDLRLREEHVRTRATIQLGPFIIKERRCCGRVNSSTCRSACNSSYV